MKTIRTTFALEKEKFVVPRSAQETIPVNAVYDDGIFLCGRKFSATYQFADIDYFAVSHEEQEMLFRFYGELLNSFDTSATAKITVFVRPMDTLAFEREVLLPALGDEADPLRKEYNQVLLAKAAASNNMIRQTFLTISVAKQNVEEAREFFARIGSELATRFEKMRTAIERLDSKERLRIFHDFYRSGEEIYYDFDPRQQRRRSHSFKDFVCPDGLKIEASQMQIGERYARVLTASDYASYLKDEMVCELTESMMPMMLSIDIIPVPTDEAVRTVSNVKMGINTNAVRFRRKQEGNADLPFEMQQEMAQLDEMFEDLTANDKRMMFVLITLVHTADDLKTLNTNTESLQAIAQNYNCRLRRMTFEQLEGLKTVLPFGVVRVRGERTFTTDPAATLIPFRARDLQDKGGIYYGVHQVSHNLVLADRTRLRNANGFIFGTSGSGKSFVTKMEAVCRILASGDDIIFIDPENEFARLVARLGGTVINLSPSTNTFINAMDINKDYGDGASPIPEKAGFILSLCEQLLGGRLTPGEKSIIDRVTGNLYKEFVTKGYEGSAPTLADFHSLLNEVSEDAREIARDISIAMELFTTGSLNIFAHETNVDMDNRMLCFNIKDLGSQLRTVGMLVVLDTVLNRISRNRAQKRRTWIYIDEIHVLFSNQYSMDFLNSMWKRVRKFGASLTGITQNVDEMLKNEECRALVANSEFVLMLNQAATDRERLVQLYNLSDKQKGYITGAAIGHGLLKHGDTFIPIANDFPADTELYRLMTTKMEEA